jgi:hypothetical protein
MQDAASAPPRHPNPRGRVSFRLSLPGWHLLELRPLELRLRQMSCLQGEHLERLNHFLAPFQAHRGTRRKILNLTRQHRRHHPACSSVIRTADLANRLALAAGSYHAPGET